jgi:hypothetical protein
MKKKSLKLIPLLICVLFAITLIPQTSATVVFTEDFDEVMDWTVGQGNFTTYEYAPSDYALYSGISGTVGQWCWTQTPDMSDGSWSFDFVFPQLDNGWMRLYFFLNGTLGDPWYGYHFYGYYLEIDIDDWTDPTSLRLMKIDNGTVTLLGIAVFDNSICGTWTEIDVTRNSANGEIDVWVNGTLEIQENDSTFTHSEKFCFYNEKQVNTVLVGAMLDNLVIDDELPQETTTTTTTTTTTGTGTGNGNGEPFVLDPMLLAIGAGVVVLLIVIFVIVKRK